MKTVKQLKSEIFTQDEKIKNMIFRNDIEAYKIEARKGDALRKERREATKFERLNEMNKNHAKKREIFAALQGLELPTEDIRTNDGYFNKTKLKKFPALEKFISVYNWATFEFHYESGQFYRAKIQGDYFNILQPKNNSYARFENTEAGLIWSGILLKNMTFKQFKAKEKKILAVADKLRASQAAASAKFKELDAYFLNNENLIGLDSSRGYNYDSI